MNSTPKQNAFSNLPISNWRVSRRYGMSDVFLGLIKAPDKVKAMELAIRMFQITDPMSQRRLIAERT
jgi:hypothetical protein